MVFFIAFSRLQECPNMVAGLRGVAVPFAAGVRLSLHANTKVVQQLAESYMQAIGPDPSAGMLLQQPLEYLSQFQAQLGLNPCNPSDDKRVLQLGLRSDDKQGLNPELHPAHVLRLVPSPWQSLERQSHALTLHQPGQLEAAQLPGRHG